MQRTARAMARPLFGLSRRGFSTATTVSPLVLYQYAICPFCHQSKAFLDYYRIPYETIEVNPLTKAEIRTFRDKHNYKQVPIATLVPTNDESSKLLPLLGSDEIIRHAVKSSTRDESDDEKWATFARKELAVLLYPNLCRTLSSSYAAFGYVHQVNNSFSWLQRMSVQMIGSLAMYMAASRVKKKYDIVDEAASLNEAMEKLEAALLLQQQQPAAYLSATSSEAQRRPGAGDLIVYGTLRSLEVASPTLHSSTVASRPAVAQWYQLMTEQVANGI